MWLDDFDFGVGVDFAFAGGGEAGAGGVEEEVCDVGELGHVGEGGFVFGWFWDGGSVGGGGGGGEGWGKLAAAGEGELFDCAEAFQTAGEGDEGFGGYGVVSKVEEVGA